MTAVQIGLLNHGRKHVVGDTHLSQAGRYTHVISKADHPVDGGIGLLFGGVARQTEGAGHLREGRSGHLAVEAEPRLD